MSDVTPECLADFHKRGGRIRKGPTRKARMTDHLPTGERKKWRKGGRFSTLTNDTIRTGGFGGAMNNHGQGGGRSYVPGLRW